MPHICTRCNNIFEYGEDILKGCPTCGWKKFMFMRKVPQSENTSASPSEQIITRAMGVRMPPKRETESLDIEKPAIKRSADESALNKEAIASSAIQTPSFDEKDGKSSENIQSKEKKESKRQDETGLMGGKALESVKITAPGTYELNLSSLFERDGLIMAVKDETYFIDLTSAFKKSKKD